MLQRLTARCAVIALCAALAACNRDESAPAPVRGARPDSASGEVAQYALMTNSIGWLTDSNIVALARQVNASSMQIAQLEAQTWGSEPLHALALDIVRDHARMQVSIDSMAERKRIPSQLPAIAPMMQAPYDSMLSTQVGLPTSEREAKLIEMLFKVHERSTVDFGALAGNATDPDLRALLATRGILMEQQHQARTKLFATAIAKADSVKQDSAKTSRRGGRRQ